MRAGAQAVTGVACALALTLSATSATSATSTQVQAEATAAAARVDELVARQRAASAAVQRAVAALTGSVRRTAQAEAADDAARERLRRGREDQTRQIRALYAEGGTLGVGLSVITADSPDDVLWRADTIGLVLGRWSVAATAADSRARAVLAASEARSAAGREADAAHGQELDRAQGEEQAAAAALAEARRTLGTLSARARTLRTAEDAAARLAAAAAAAAAARAAATAGAVTPLGIPAEFEAAYRAAAPSCPGMRWTLLAGLGQVESGHGRNNGPSSAGAIGPMQFLPSTFASVGLDGDADGLRDPWDPQDAVLSAAHYLCISGAAGGTPEGLRRALFAYNHAEWYVDLVLRTETAIVAQQAALTPP